jgi:hypothetical protein
MEYSIETMEYRVDVINYGWLRQDNMAIHTSKAYREKQSGVYNL